MSKLYKCTKCGKKKQEYEFPKRSSRPKGVGSWCKICISIRDKEYYENMKNYIIERQRQYYILNKDKKSEYNKKYKKENREKLLEYYKEYDKENKYKRGEYRKSHLVEDAVRSAKRRAKKNSATPSWLTQTDTSKIKSIYKMANSLTKKTGIKHQVDHIVPLVSDIVCGLHVPWNLQVLTASENASKSNKLINEDMV